MTTPQPISSREREILTRAIAKLRSSILALTFSMVGGTCLFLATAFLVIRDGPNVGQHLQLLSQYFPGYTVTWAGSVVGLLYGALTGAVLGWSIASIYNRVSSRRKS